MMPRPGLEGKLRFGFVVLGILIALEITEYVVGTTIKSGAWHYLAVLAVIGAWPILQYFMHITHLWRPEK